MSQGGQPDPLGNTTIFTANPSQPTTQKLLKKQLVKDVFDPETGELFQYTYCEKLHQCSMTAFE